MGKKKQNERFRCDQLEGEKFYAAQDDVFRYNWWEVFCFPYILCARLWDCCISLCSGANQCLLYWMAIQWIICKITRMTTPDPILFPYFFYLFCQVLLLTLFFIIMWMWLGKKVLVPYFVAFYEALSTDFDPDEFNITRTGRRMAFRKYCFKKSELFDVPQYDGGSFLTPRVDLGIATVLLDIYLYWEYY